MSMLSINTQVSERLYKNSEKSYEKNNLLLIILLAFLVAACSSEKKIDDLIVRAEYLSKDLRDLSRVLSSPENMAATAADNCRKRDDLIGEIKNINASEDQSLRRRVVENFLVLENNYCVSVVEFQESVLNVRRSQGQWYGRGMGGPLGLAMPEPRAHGFLRNKMYGTYGMLLREEKEIYKYGWKPIWTAEEKNVVAGNDVDKPKYLQSDQWSYIKENGLLTYVETGKQFIWAKKLDLSPGDVTYLVAAVKKPDSGGVESMPSRNVLLISEQTLFCRDSMFLRTKSQRIFDGYRLLNSSMDFSAPKPVSSDELVADVFNEFCSKQGFAYKVLYFLGLGK